MSYNKFKKTHLYFNHIQMLYTDYYTLISHCSYGWSTLKTRRY